MKEIFIGIVIIIASIFSIYFTLRHIDKIKKPLEESELKWFFIGLAQGVLILIGLCLIMLNVI